mgnify:CR=1 FL=1
MLAEVMFSIDCNLTHTLTMDTCMTPLYQAIETYMFALNADILALNNSLK